jgi:hypothetical protein
MSELSLTPDEMAEYDSLCLRYDAIGDMDPDERAIHHTILAAEQRWIERRLSQLDEKPIGKEHQAGEQTDQDDRHQQTDEGHEQPVQQADEHPFPLGVKP